VTIPATLAMWHSTRHIVRDSGKSGNPSGVTEKMPKPKKVGRPKLPKGEAKGRIVPVRFAKDELRGIEADAKAKMKTLSEWIRTVLQLGVKQRYKNYLIELAVRGTDAGYTAYGWITNQNGATRPIPVESPGPHPTEESALEYGVSWCMDKIDAR
jgi:hypothetical protein